MAKDIKGNSGSKRYGLSQSARNVSLIVFYQLIRLILVIVCSAVILSCVLLFLITFSTPSPKQHTNYFLFLICCLVMLYTAALIHELGHVIAAVIVRKSIVEVCIYPFLLVRQKDKYSFRFPSKRSSLRHAYVKAVKSKHGSHLLCECLFILGGILANLVIALICFLILREQSVLSNDELVRRGWAGVEEKMAASPVTGILVAFTGINVFVAFANLLPTTHRQFPNDGAQLIAVLMPRMGRIPPHLQPRPRLGGEHFTKLRPREWNMESIERLRLAAKDPGKQAQGELYGYYRALDQGQIEQAGKHLELALASVENASGKDRSAILLERAYYEGFHRRNAAAARMWLHMVEANDLYEYTFLRGAAAVLLAERLYSNAAESAQAAITQAEKSPDVGGVEAEKEWLNAIIESCHQPMKQEDGAT